MSIIAMLASAPLFREVEIAGLVFRIARLGSSQELLDTGIPVLLADRRGRVSDGEPPDLSFQERYRDALICAAVRAVGLPGRPLEDLTVCAYGESSQERYQLSVLDIPLGVRGKLSQEIAAFAGFGGEVVLGQGSFPAGGPDHPGQGGAEIRD